MNNSSREKNKKELIKQVIGDSRRVPYEKETIFRFNREEKKVYINSFDPTVVKGLLRHKYFEVESYNRNEKDRIIGISGNMPRGILKVKKEPRKRDYPSTIISSEGTEK